ncbi:MAG: hypothetical protein OEM82_12340 [Acidobacteriota bacterium]|nr:hypothetical protein [Acidobacteriota bacterium]MDH3528003.1 hypothetical protein [Acidobacteriota bacterium]
MLLEIVSEYSRFVIFLGLTAFCSTACDLASLQTETNVDKEVSVDYGEARILGRIDSPKITESSGIASSLCQENVFWTHNDSGDGGNIYALDDKARLIGEFTVSGALNRDWEDIASFKSANGECFLFIADTGNNGRSRSSFAIYKLKEPKIKKEGPAPLTEKAVPIIFSYPDMRHDAESIFVHPESETIYVITKRISDAAGVYKLEKGSGTAKKVADIEVPSVPKGLITGAAISPDGKRVIICDYFGGYEYVLPKDATDFDDIWNEKPRLVDLGVREQGEAVSYSADGLSIYATSEHRNAPLIIVSRRIE